MESTEMPNSPKTEAESQLTTADLERLCVLMHARLDIDDVLRTLSLEKLREVLLYVRSK